MQVPCRLVLAAGALSLACSSSSDPSAAGGAGGSSAIGGSAGNGVNAAAGSVALSAGSGGAAIGGDSFAAAGVFSGGGAGAAANGGSFTGSVAGSAGASVASAGSGGTAGSATGAPLYDYGVPVENSSADCAVPALADPSALVSNPKLPDPFKRLDGTTLTKKSEWHCRRQEILKQAEKYIYGTRPPKPEVVTGSVTNGKVSVHVEAMGKSIDFSANIELPSTGAAPYPAIINVGSSGMTLGEARVLEQGVAVIYYNHNELGREGQPEQSRGDPNSGKFYDLFGGTHSAGLLQAWSWGASRLIDVLQSAEGVIDPSRLGVTGCSRNGKGAFATGLFDERIALTIPHETSTAGVPAYRIVDVLNTERTDHNYNGLNWLSNDFEPFVYRNGTSNAVKLPIDTHSLIASMAPRGVFIIENPHATQMSAPAGHTAAVSAAEVYEALGVAENLSYQSAVAQTSHCQYNAEYTELLVANIKKFLKHESAETGKIVVGTNGSLELSDWKDWEAPTLSE